MPNLEQKTERGAAQARRDLAMIGASLTLPRRLVAEARRAEEMTMRDPDRYDKAVRLARVSMRDAHYWFWEYRGDIDAAVFDLRA